MKRVAVIGSGISGLAAAYFLSSTHDVHVFEKDDRIGGHTNTIMVQTSAGALPIDTGFIVFNERTYPRFCRLMNELGVRSQPSDMSFAVTYKGGEFEYSSRGVLGFFAQGSNLLSLTHYKLLADILRFNRTAPSVLERDEAAQETLGDFLRASSFSHAFVSRYLIPMTSAVWSASPSTMLSFPLKTLVRFMDQHGMLGINTHPQWRAILGGSQAYLGPLTAPFQKNIRTSASIRSVIRSRENVTLHFADHAAETFDHVVFACSAEKALALLDKPSPAEREVLGAFATTRNEAILHTDSSFLPVRPRARASWNYELGDASKVTLTYHMNRLQALPTRVDYCVTLNPGRPIREDLIVRRIDYEHPIFTAAAIHAQEKWPKVSGIERTHYCGAYWFYGFHEDGVRSGLRVAEAIQGSAA